MQPRKRQLNGSMEPILKHLSVLPWLFNRSWAIALTLFTASLIVLTSCAQEPPPPLRVGTVVWTGYDNLYVAKELGYYNSTPIRLVNYSSVADQIRAFQNGELEAVALTMGDALVLSENISDLRTVLVLDSSFGADVVLAKPAIKYLSELKGKRVGVEASGLGAFMLARTLESVKLTPKDVQIVSVGGSEHEQAFKQGTIDAVITYEPTRSHLLASGATILFDSTQIPGEVVDVMVVRNETLTQRGPVLQDLINGWFRAHTYAQKNPQDAARKVAGRNNLSPDQILQALKGIQIPSLEENQVLLGKTKPTLINATKKLTTVMVQGNFLKKPADASSMLDDRLVKDAKA